MSTTVNGDNGEATLESTVRDALLLRGVLNVGEDLLAQGSMPFGLPLERDSLPELRDVNRRLERRMAGTPPDETIREVLGPGEKQAVKNALLSVESLLSTDDGRDVLSRVGLIANPDSPTVREELADIGDWIEQLNGDHDVVEADLDAATSSMAALFEEASVRLRQVRDDPPSTTFIERRRTDLRSMVSGEPTCEQLVEVFGGVSILLSAINAKPGMNPRDRNPILSDLRSVWTAAIDLAAERGCIPGDMGLLSAWGEATDAVIPASEGRMIDVLERALSETREAFLGSVETPSGPGNTRAGVPDSGEILDPTLPIVDAFAVVDADIVNESILYPGAEQASFMLHGIDDGVTTSRSCEGLVYDALELLLLTVAAGRRGDIGDHSTAAEDSTYLDLLAGDIFGLMADRGCIEDEVDRQLHRAFGEVLRRVERGGDVDERALDFTTLLDEATGRL